MKITRRFQCFLFLVLALPLLGGREIASARFSSPDLEHPETAYFPANNNRESPAFTLQADQVHSISQIGGSTNAIAVQDHYTYLSEGSAMTILDISNPAEPLLASRTSPLTDLSITDVFISGGQIYTLSDGRLIVIDVSDSSNPNLVSDYTLQSRSCNGLVIAGSYAFIICSEDGLLVIDISNPISPVEVGYFDTPGNASDVAISGNFAYIADYHGGLQVIDISDPSEPAEVGVFDPEENFTHLALAGNYVYLGEDTNHLRVINVSDPTNPTQAGILELSGFVEDLEIVGNYAYVVNYYFGLYVLDLSNPAVPEIIGSYHSPTYAEGVAVLGTNAYITRVDGGVWVVDISNPVHPDMIGGYDSLGNVLNLSFAWPYAYVLDQNGLWVVDMNNSASPLLTGFADTTYWAREVEIAGDYAYVSAYSNGLRVIDVSDPVNPVEVSHYSISDAQSVAISGDYAFVAALLGLYVMDIFDPLLPKEISLFTTPSNAVGVEVSGNYAYVSVLNSGLQVIDISDPAQPAAMGFVNLSTYPRGLKVIDPYVYIAAGSGLVIIDASNPADPTQVGWSSRGGSDIAVSDGLAYLVGSSHLLIKDISDPANPFEVDAYPTPGGGSGVVTYLEDIYIANGSLGLLALRNGTSPIMVIPNRLPADSLTRATVTVTLRNNAGQALAGKAVQIFSSRSPLDFLEQPRTLTDTQGRTTGWISSSQAGTSVLTAINLTDGTLVTGIAEVQFTQTSQAIRNKVIEYNAASISHLNTIESYAREGAGFGDDLRLTIRSEGVKVAMDSIFYIFSGVGTIKSMAGPSTEVLYPGLKTLTESQKISTVYKEAGDLFHRSLIEAYKSRNLEPLSKEILLGGAKYYSAKIGDKFINDEIKGKLFESFEMIAELDRGLSELAAYHQVDSINLATALDENTTSVLTRIPALTPEEETDYLEDLTGRMQALTIRRLALYQKLILLDSIQSASDVSDPFIYVASKFLLKDIGASFLGPGKLLIDTVDLGLKMWITSQKVSFQERAYQAAPLLLFGVAESDAQTFSNQLAGMERLVQRTPPITASADVLSKQNFSEGVSQLLNYWNETAAYTIITLKNTGTEPTLYEIYGNYMYDAQILGTRWAVMPVTANGALQLAPGETGSVSLYYKNGEEGGSPIPDGNILLMVLGTNSTGTFYIQTDTFAWQDISYLQSGELSSTYHEFEKPIRLPMDEPPLVIENPLDTYMLSDPANNVYIFDLFASNPFTESVQVSIQQILPPEFEPVSTDGQVGVDQITWQRQIPAGDFVRLQYTITNPDALPGEWLELPSATMELVDPNSHQVYRAAANPVQFKANWPLVIEASVPSGFVGHTNSVPIKIRNVSNTTIRGSMILRLTDGIGSEVYKLELVYLLEPGQEFSIPFQIPDLPAGGYIYEISPHIGDAIERLATGSYLVWEPVSLYLPIVRK